MCSCDATQPKFFMETFHKAQVKHKCCECNCTIEIGERYHKATGKWDGDIETFKTCSDCLAIHDELSNYPCYCKVFEELHDTTFKYLNEFDYMSKESVSLLRLIVSHRATKDRKTK